MTSVVRKMLVLFFAGLLTAAFAADNYYFQDALGDHDLANAANWTKNDQATVPDSLPAIDMTTSGGTHPLMNFTKSGTLALPNADSLTLQDLIFQTANQEVEINLGSKAKTLKLFGSQNAAMWVGGNTPNGQKVVFKNGTLSNAASPQRHWAVRLGASGSATAPASFTIDGEDAVVSNLTAVIDSPKCALIVTNGAQLVVNAKNAVSLTGGHPGAKLVVSGAGSVFRQMSTELAMLFGDAFYKGESGSMEITDGGMVTNASATIGNRSANFSVLMDKGTWQGANVTLGGSPDATSTNNSLVVRNGSHLVLTSTLGIGTYGGLSRALVESSEITASTVNLGARGGYGRGYNVMTISNSTFGVSTFNVGGKNGDGANACNNTLEIRKSQATSASAIYLANREGGGATNHLIVADSTIALGSIAVGQKPGGHNTVLVTNCTMSASFTIGGQAGTTACGSDGNVVRIVDSTLGTPTDCKTSFYLANSQTDCPARSNVIEFVHSTWYNKQTYLGIGGWPGSSQNQRGNDGNAMILDDRSLAVCTNGSNGVCLGTFGFGNRLEVKNGSTFIAHSISVGSSGSNYASVGTNVIYVGTNSMVITPKALLTFCTGGHEVIIDNGCLAPHRIGLHYYSPSSKGTKDSLTGAEEEYGKTAQELWGTKFVFKGEHPVLWVPYNDDTSSSAAGLGFDRSCSLTFELPEEPYAQPPLQSCQTISFGDTIVNFDLSEVGIAGGRYVLADQTESGSLTVSDAQLAAMQEALTAAATAVGRRARIFVDGKKLVVKVSKKYGLMVILR